MAANREPLIDPGSQDPLNGTTPASKERLPPSDLINQVPRRESLRPWRPLFLRRSVLACFFLVFATILVALSILRWVSKKNQGLCSVRGGDHYLWTYGPVAIFLVLRALWYQVDYAARRAMPWLAIAEGATAGDSLT